MTRRAIVLGTALVAAVFAGCDSGGLSAGDAEDKTAPPQTADFKKIMQENSKNMELKGGWPKDVKPVGVGTPQPGMPGPAGPGPAGPGRPAGPPGRR